jgi:hypothetical protein
MRKAHPKGEYHDDTSQRIWTAKGRLRRSEAQDVPNNPAVAGFTE